MATYRPTLPRTRCLLRARRACLCLSLILVPACGKSGEKTPLTPPASPEPVHIAFTSLRDGDPEIYALSSDSTAQIRMTSNSAVDRDPTWSPDGSQIAFVSERDGNPEIYVMNSDSQENPGSRSREDKLCATDLFQKSFSSGF